MRVKRKTQDAVRGTGVQNVWFSAWGTTLVRINSSCFLQSNACYKPADAEPKLRSGGLDFLLLPLGVVGNNSLALLGTETPARLQRFASTHAANSSTLHMHNFDRDVAI